MFSDALTANLSEVLGSINLSYQYYLKEEGQESIQLEYVIQTLYELLKKQDLKITNEYVKTLKEYVSIISDLQKKDLFKNVSNDSSDVQSFYKKGLGYSQLYMSIAICDRVLNQRYFIQFYQVNDEEANYIKNLLTATIIFLKNFIDYLKN
jgi:hypothetical protein